MIAIYLKLSSCLPSYGIVMYMYEYSLNRYGYCFEFLPFEMKLARLDIMAEAVNHIYFYLKEQLALYIVARGKLYFNEDTCILISNLK